MAKQIFVQKVNATPANTGGTTGSDFHGGNAGDVGVWSVDGGAMLASNLVPSSGIATIKDFQIVQSNGANDIPYASPIINFDRVKKITCTMAGAANLTVATTAAETVGTCVVGTEYYFKVAQIGPVGGFQQNYEDFINPSAASKKVFDRAKHIINYSYTATATAAATNATAIRDVINADADGFLTASVSTADLTVAMKAGLGGGFRVTTNIPGLTNNAKYNGAFGNGSGYVAVELEKEYSGYQTGYHNRLHLPQTPTRYADASLSYDVIKFEIDQVELNGPKTNVGNDTMTLEWWIPSAWTDGGSNLDAIFAGAGAGAVDMDSSASADAVRILYAR